MVSGVVVQFITYGFFQCVDGFLFIFTFLPLRFIKAVFKFCVRGFLTSWSVLAFEFKIELNDHIINNSINTFLCSVELIIDVLKAYSDK